MQANLHNHTYSNKCFQITAYSFCHKGRCLPYDTSAQVFTSNELFMLRRERERERERLGRFIFSDENYCSGDQGYDPP